MKLSKTLLISLFLLIIAFCIILYVAYEDIVDSDVVVVLLTATLGAMSWLIKSEYDKLRELECLTYESRRQAYDKLLQPFIDVMTSMKLDRDINHDDLTKSIIEAGTKLFIYGSDDVCDKFNNFRIAGQEGKQNNYRILAEYGRLLLSIMKDSGFPDTEITVEGYIERVYC